MGSLHDVIEAKGKQEALLLGLDRRAVEAAAAYMGDEDAGIGFLYSGWCQAALPHKKLADDEEWQIHSDHVSMIVQPGLRANRTGPAKRVGVPYGSRARLIMFYIQSEAVRTDSRDVHLGRSLNQWMTRMGISAGGKSSIGIKDQAERISLCSFTFDGKGIGTEAIHRLTVFDKAVFSDQDATPGQGSLFPQVARLSEQFFVQLTSHPVPLDEAAVRAISNNSMSLDLYAWLAYRLHVLRGPTPVSWTALMRQFGTGYRARFHFREHFLVNLSLSLAVYRDARVEISDRGVTLFPSKPPVPPKQFALKPATPTFGRTQAIGRVQVQDAPIAAVRRDSAHEEVRYVSDPNRTPGRRKAGL